jgi:hypothetical protein
MLASPQGIVAGRAAAMVVPRRDHHRGERDALFSSAASPDRTGTGRLVDTRIERDLLQHRQFGRSRVLGAVVPARAEWIAEGDITTGKAGSTLGDQVLLFG